MATVTPLARSQANAAYKSDGTVNLCTAQTLTTSFVTTTNIADVGNWVSIRAYITWTQDDSTGMTIIPQLSPDGSTWYTVPKFDANGAGTQDLLGFADASWGALAANGENDAAVGPIMVGDARYFRFLVRKDSGTNAETITIDIAGGLGI